VHSLGLQVAQGLNLTESFYWDLNNQTRDFSKRFAERVSNKSMPTMVQAGVYSAIIHYLKVLDSEGRNSHDGAKIVAAMKAMPTDDPLFGKGSYPLIATTCLPLCCSNLA
jgi:branched-chain amino acid transport system substrate-binding protein